jgi:hypothetical protein
MGDKLGKAAAEVLTDAEIREGYYKLAASHSALVKTLLAKGYLKPHEVAAMERVRDEIVKQLLAADEQLREKGRVIRPA